MGQKVNPYGFRLGITTDWKSRWFADRQEYADNVVEERRRRAAGGRRARGDGGEQRGVDAEAFEPDVVRDAACGAIEWRQPVEPRRGQRAVGTSAVGRRRWDGRILLREQTFDEPLGAGP